MPLMEKVIIETEGPHPTGCVRLVVVIYMESRGIWPRTATTIATADKGEGKIHKEEEVISEAKVANISKRGILVEQQTWKK